MPSRNSGGHTQVELLLDGERPEVAEQPRPAELGEVALVREHEAPVGHVEDRCERVVAQADELAPLDRGADEQADRQQQEQRGQQPARAPGPEAQQRDAPALVELGDQQRGDQVAADHEEDVHAEEAAGQPRDVGVVEEHSRHRDRAQAVDPRHAAQPRRRRSPARGAAPCHRPSMGQACNPPPRELCFRLFARPLARPPARRRRSHGHSRRAASRTARALATGDQDRSGQGAPGRRRRCWSA